MTLAERIERVPLARPMALLVAAAVAFPVYAVPAALVARLAARSGLTGLLPAIVPFTAADRTIAAALLALLAGAATWLLFHRLDHPRAARPADAEDDLDTIDLFAPAPPQLPQLRRADAHPDAPPRRPLFAASDLGAPLDPEPSVQRAPLFRDPEPVEAAGVDDAGEDDVPAGPLHPADPVEPLLLDGSYMVGPALDDAIPVPPPHVDGEWEEVTAPAAPPPPATPDAPLAELMARLERGLSARVDPVAPTPHDASSTLAQALDELRQMAARR